MPIITQANGVKSVKGLPPRWGERAYQALAAELPKTVGEPVSERYTKLAGMLDSLTSAPLALDVTEAQICMMAEKCASECVNVAMDVHDTPAMRRCVEFVVKMYGLDAPLVADDQGAVLRCMDAAWWKKNLRVLQNRTREHAAMRLGFVSSRAGKYCSDEAARSRVGQNRRNQKTLQSISLENVETGQVMTLDDLAARGVGNNKNRRGELMLRMDGCDEISMELGHVGLFVTLTAPGAYHSVLEVSGKPNPNYNLATPRETQDYLRDVWARTRTRNGRQGVRPYGFRVAEPHHDGCTHWHMVVFMPLSDVEKFKANLRRYALEEDGDAPGAQKRRVTFELLDPNRGSAAAYLMKYVAKNIGDNKFEEDAKGNTIISREMRVDAWAGTWGIRQFQPIGQPPVTVYREMRRLKEEAIAQAAECVRAAWLAANRLDLIDEETGEIAGVKKCSFAAYIRAQGGINMGRDYRVAVAVELRAVAGRYGMVDRECPIGVVVRPEAGFCGPMPVFKSVRYTWRRPGVGVVVALRLPRSPVNNCTDYAPPPWDAMAPEPEEMAPNNDSEWWGNADFSVFETQDYQDFVETPEAGRAIVAALAACERYERGFCFFEGI